MSTNSVIPGSSLTPANVSAAVKPQRYHPLLVALHWLIAILIFGAVLLVQENEGGAPRQENQSIFSNNGLHMILGISILVLLLIRLAVRWRTQHPEWATTGNRFFDWIGSLTHLGLYLLTFGMAITGIILANQRGILARVFGIGSTGTHALRGFRFGMLHGGTWILLLLLIILHVGAALYHQFILKDHLMGRMWFGKNQ